MNKNETSVSIAGHVSRVVTYIDETSFGVYVVATPEGEVTIVGTLPELIPGEKISVECKPRHHPLYGDQFVVTGNLKVNLPQRHDMVENMLAKGFAYGIAETYASNLAGYYGADIFSVFRKIEAALRHHYGEPQKGEDDTQVDQWVRSIAENRSKAGILSQVLTPLTDVPGIGKKRALSLVQGWIKNQNRHEAMLFLYQFGLTPAMIQRVINTYRPWVIEKISKDPYSLVSNADIPFKLADEIAKNLGFQDDCPQRIDAGILHILGETETSGDTSILKSDLENKASVLLQLDADLISERIASERNLFFIDKVNDLEYVSSSQVVSTEYSIALNILRLKKESPAEFAHKLNAVIGKAESRNGFTLDTSQRQAIDMAASNNIGIVTGGAGTGKSTIMRIIVDAAESAGLNVALCSPTGKAAKRLQQVTGHPASTIHRLIKYRPWVREITPIDADVIIVDEASMIDLYLFNALLTAVEKGSRLILVGDPHQLPSVGPGNVLDDLISIENIPSVTLDTIHRQKQGDEPGGIIENAAIVNNVEQGTRYGALRPGRFSTAEFCAFTEQSIKMSRVTSENREQLNNWIATSIVKAVSEVLPQRFGFNPYKDIQVLLPMRVGKLGTNRLNMLLQEQLNPNKGQPEIPFRRGDGTLWKWRVNDRVICVQNDYDKDVFNGEQGLVTYVNPQEKTIEVYYDDLNQTCQYKYNELDMIEPAYAMTIHKSQGSEFPCVVMGITYSHYPMLERQLLYTGITRASDKCLLFCETSAIGKCLQKERKKRLTLLRNRIQEIINSKNIVEAGLERS